MPYYMDVHPEMARVTPADIAEAHKRDLAIQGDFGVRFLTYWFNDEAGKAFCLVEAPDPESAVAAHKASHGLMPHDVIEVQQPALNLFMGDWYRNIDDRAMVGGTSDPDSGLRAIVFTDIEGSTDVSTRLGDDAAMDLVRSHNSIVRSSLENRGGREVKHTGDGILACFGSVSRAVDATVEIQKGTSDVDGLGIKIGLTVGEPVEESDDIYGASVNLAARICSHATGGQILTSSAVRDLTVGKNIAFAERGMIALKGFPDPVHLYEVDWT